DGTLLRSCELDGALYARAFLDIFGMPLPSTDWNSYRNVTDRGIAEEAVARLGLPARGIAEFRPHFIALTSRLEEIDPVPGAAQILAELQRAGHKIAIATGSWQEAARHKLRIAGIDIAQLPLVGSDEDATREGILRAAIARLGSGAPVVYVGDAEWDLRASRNLGIGFVCVCAEGNRFGAPTIRDFVDRRAFAEALSRSRR
ncbi:MAG TPA: HAD family hydrolase, partial [Candidatus Cybelea sp.]|nr:HAD family hydrolase [Candidatus Cybelea sp.]